ncbi:MAG: hypothetical protein K2P98_05390 [Neisseriaceae bacterium]|nr:hypothetical protein [Neisseriaceae bacterium]
MLKQLKHADLRVFMPNLGLLCLMIFLGTACATSTSISKTDNRWERLGISASGNIVHEIAPNSIMRGDNGMVIFGDRKVILDTKLESFENDLVYKQALNVWSIDCVKKTLTLRQVTLLDTSGKTIAEYKTDTVQNIVPKSASDYQYQYVCVTHPPKK